MNEIETERILSYFDKIRDLEVLLCQDHDLEFLEGEECPDCERERNEFLNEMKEQRI